MCCHGSAVRIPQPNIHRRDSHQYNIALHSSVSNLHIHIHMILRVCSSSSPCLCNTPSESARQTHRLFSVLIQCNGEKQRVQRENRGGLSFIRCTAYTYCLGWGRLFIARPNILSFTCKCIYLNSGAFAVCSSRRDALSLSLSLFISSSLCIAEAFECRYFIDVATSESAPTPCEYAVLCWLELGHTAST